MSDTTDFIKSKTQVWTVQLDNTKSNDVLIQGGFMLTDFIISNHSEGKTTLLVTDDIHTHIIAVVGKDQTFSHAFEGGWNFWNEARLEIIKESPGIVDVSCGYVKINSIQNYNQWIRR